MTRKSWNSNAQVNFCSKNHALYGWEVQILVFRNYKNVSGRFLKIVLKAENCRHVLIRTGKWAEKTAMRTAGCLWRLFIDVLSISLLINFFKFFFFFNISMTTQNIGYTHIRKHLQCKGLAKYYTGRTGWPQRLT